MCPGIACCSAGFSLLACAVTVRLCVVLIVCRCRWRQALTLRGSESVQVQVATDANSVWQRKRAGAGVKQGKGITQRLSLKASRQPLMPASHAASASRQPLTTLSLSLFPRLSVGLTLVIGGGIEKCRVCGCYLCHAVPLLWHCLCSLPPSLLQSVHDSSHVFCAFACTMRVFPASRSSHQAV